MGGHVGRLQPDGRSRVRQSRKHMPRHRRDIDDGLRFRRAHRSGRHRRRGRRPREKPVLPLDHGDSRHRRCAGARIVRHAIPQRRPCIRTTHIDRANRENVGLDEMGDCKNTSHGLIDSPSLPKSSLDDGDWKCVAYTDSQRTELTVHINGNRVGLYKADGTVLKPVGKN